VNEEMLSTIHEVIKLAIIVVLGPREKIEHSFFQRISRPARSNDTFEFYTLDVDLLVLR